MSEAGSYEDFEPAQRSESSHTITPAAERFEYVDRALQLVSFDPSTKSTCYTGFQLTEEALDFLRSLPAPLGVVSVAGMYRTGKSYLLNRIILNRKSGFGVGPTVNPCTKGMWVWGRPIAATTADGEPCSIIVVDSEGIGALDEDSDHDTRVFSLAILIASFFIYNSTGAIDESAIENLSLVVNLTKHIHIKSQQVDDPDGEEYAAYFPAFMWVVRDFTLRLVSPEGDPIAAKEYLERALQPQKGFTDAVEDKNRVRRLLKNFFKERDCFTLVRPVQGEQNLQRLADLELDDLRSEFVEQMMLLRKKVVNKVKPKMLNGKCLTGAMLANLIETYITSMNEGIVPSIESAWTYICQTECSHAFEEAADIYERVVKSNVDQRIPMSEEELRAVHKEARDAAISHFSLKAVGSDKDTILRSLTDQLSQKYAALKSENADEAEAQITQFLHETYSVIDRRLNNGEFQSLANYEKEAKAFMTYFLEQAPQGPKRRELMLDFCSLKHAEAADYFLKNVTNELQLTQQLSAENYSRLEAELRETKEELLKQRDAFQRKLTTLESEKAELSALSQSTKEQVQHLRAERDRVEKELRESQKTMKQDLSRQLEEASAKTGQFEESMKEMERRLFQAESEHQQEKALLAQKVTFLEKSLEESSKREKDYLTELKSQKASHTQAIRELSSKHETAIKTYQNKFDTETDKSGDLEKLLTEKETQLESLKAQKEETEALMTAKAAELHNQLMNARKLMDQRDEEHKQRTAELTSEHETSISKLKSRLEELERKLKTSEETYKTEQTQWLRTNAVLQQKVDFLELQEKEKITQLEDLRKQNEALAREIQSSASTDSQEELQTQMQRLRDQHSIEIRQLEQRLDDHHKKSTVQLEDQVEKFNALELKLKLDANEWTYKEKQLIEKVEALNEEKAKLSERVKVLMSENTLLNEEGAAKLKQKIKELERQVEELNAKASSEISSINSKSEESLQQLKTFYELEKERLERRVIEEKEKAESRYSFMVEEFEQKIREDADLAADQRQDLEDQLTDLETMYANDTTQLKQQIALDSQKIETLEKHLKETKDNLASIHTSHALAIEQQLENFNKERVLLLEKVERLAGDSAAKEKELATVTYKKEQLESQLAFKEKELEETRGDYGSERSVLAEKLEEAKTKWRLVADELSKKKSEFMKENALAAQQIEFHAKKIAEMTKQKEDLERKLVETAATLKEEKNREIAEVLEKAQAEREAQEKKMEVKRRAFKETEANYVKQLAAVEKERAVTSEKLSNQEAKFSELESRLNQEISQMKNQLKERRGPLDGDTMALQLENERLRTLSNDQGKQLSEQASAYERDRTLWENKFNFLTSQREQARTDLTEAQKKFEQTLDELKKKSTMEKEKSEASAAAALSALEGRLTTQLKETQAASASRISELQEKNKSLERDMRILREQLELERRGRSVDSGTLEERVQNLVESEQRLMQEIELLKRERDRRVTELQEAFQTEKEELKAKAMEAEKRVKEMEQNRGQLFLEHEKERARWTMDRDHLTSQKNEAQENYQRMQKRNEALLKENEKLRAERPSKLRNPTALGKKDPAKGGINILGASISFQDYLANTQGSQAQDQRPSVSTSREGSTSEVSDQSPRSAAHSQRTRPAGGKALSPVFKKIMQNPGGPAFKIEGKEDPPQ